MYEDRIGSLQVVEPSVLGVQVAYAGYFTWLVVETTGLAEDRQDAMTEWDAPNQQVVRADASAPWEEGDGGGEPGGRADPQPTELDGLTKDELLEHAAERGVELPDAARRRPSIREAARGGLSGLLHDGRAGRRPAASR